MAPLLADAQARLINTSPVSVSEPPESLTRAAFSGHVNPYTASRPVADLLKTFLDIVTSYAKFAVSNNAADEREFGLMLSAFVTGNSILEPLLEGLLSQIYKNLSFLFLAEIKPGTCG